MELKKELQEVDGGELLEVLAEALKPQRWGGGVKAALAVAHTKKGVLLTEDPWPDEDPWRDGQNDSYVLTVEVKVPVALVSGEVEKLVERSKAALRKAALEKLETESDEMTKKLEELKRKREKLK